MKTIPKPNLPETYVVNTVDDYKNPITFEYKRMNLTSQEFFANTMMGFPLAIMLSNNCGNNWDDNWNEYDFEGHCATFKIIARYDEQGTWHIGGIYLASC